MGALNGSKFSCAACGARYVWKAEFAGRKFKCKCGQSVRCPAEDPARVTAGAGVAAEPAVAVAPAAAAVPAPAAAEDGDDLYGFADDPKPAPSIAAVAPAIPAIAPAGGGRGKGKAPTAVRAQAAAAPAAQTIGYFPGARAADDAFAKAADETGLRELYVPIGVFGVGLILAVLHWMYFDRFTLHFPSALSMVGISLVLDMVLICVGCLGAVKWLEVSFGSPGPALLKIAAISVFGPAVGHTVSYLIHDPFGIIGVILAVAISWVLFAKFFDMETLDVVILTAIIALVRWWAGYALLAALLSGMGISFGGMGGLVRSPLGEAEANSDRMVRDEIDLGRPIEAKAWLDEFGGHLFGNTPHDPCVKLVDGLIAAGCKPPLIEKDEGQATELFAELPDSDEKRAAAFKAAAAFCAVSGDTPPVDKGQKYLVMGFSSFTPPPANWRPRGK